jgi:DNA adenine methylase
VPSSALARPRPFLKWAGGKGQLLPELLARLPQRFRGYHEPFVGGGAFFFELRALGRLEGAVHLTDRNPPLIDTYATVRADVEAVIRRLRRHRNDEAEFYRVRAQDPRRLSPAARAARVIYLNRTCYNGLYRENRSGGFNVPFGRYANPALCDAENLRTVAAALRGVTLACTRYDAVVNRAEPGDLVYFDPPYQPVSATSSFTAYHRDGFGPDDQERLRDLFATLVERGVHVMLSNSDTPLVRSLYSDFAIDRVYASRAINSRADRRGKVAEVIVRAR